jgi:hypothetical protein
MMTIALHCRCIGKPGRFQALKKIFDYIASKEGVWVATRTQIAEHFKEKFPYQKGYLAPGVKRAEAPNTLNAVRIPGILISFVLLPYFTLETCISFL